jgi:hypothetical protein
MFIIGTILYSVLMCLSLSYQNKYATSYIFKLWLGMLFRISKIFNFEKLLWNWCDCGDDDEEENIPMDKKFNNASVLTFVTVYNI